MDPVASFKHQILAHGASTIASLGHVFHRCDSNGDKRLDKGEFTDLCNEIGIRVSPADVNALFERFDVDHSGQMTYEEFLVAVRPPLGAAQRALIRAAFGKMDADHNGVIELADIRALYSADKDPRVINHQKTADEVMIEFLQRFEGGSGPKSTTVKYEEFEAYYEVLASSFDTTDQFDAMMKACWKLEGGAPVAAPARVDCRGMAPKPGAKPAAKPAAKH